MPRLVRRSPVAHASSRVVTELNAGQWFGRVAAWAARHARAVLAVSLVLAVAAAVGATRIPTDAGAGTLVDTDTATYRATEQVRAAFGEEPVVVLAEGDLQNLILGPNVFRLLRLEGARGRLRRALES